MSVFIVASRQRAISTFPFRLCLNVLRPLKRRRHSARSWAVVEHHIFILALPSSVSDYSAENLERSSPLRLTSIYPPVSRSSVREDTVSLAALRGALSLIPGRVSPHLSSPLPLFVAAKDYVQATMRLLMIVTLNISCLPLLQLFVFFIEARHVAQVSLTLLFAFAIFTKLSYPL